jgi:hypothetical protein
LRKRRKIKGETSDPDPEKPEAKTKGISRKDAKAQRKDKPRKYNMPKQLRA